MMAKTLFLLSACILQLSVLRVYAQKSADERDVLQLVEKFFIALEKQDTAAFFNMHVKGARYQIIAERSDTVRTATRDATQFTFNKNEIIKERMRDSGVTVQIHDRLAMVWTPYDLWVNDKFSHCGIDVFTLFKTKEGWKIASCSYTVEKNGCDK
jgi:hypothetical protein